LLNKKLNEDSRKWFENVCDKVEDEIKTGEDTMPVVLMKNKEGMAVCPMSFDGNEEKVQFRNKIKELVLKGNYKEYIMVMCCVMTHVDQKNNTSKSMDAIVVTYFSPNVKLGEAFTFEGKEITERINMFKDGAQHSSEWDVWNMKEMERDDAEIELFDEAKKKFRESKEQPYFEKEDALRAMAKTMANNREHFIEDVSSIIEFGRYGMSRLKDENEKRDLGQGSTLSIQEFCNKLFTEYINRDAKGVESDGK